MKKMIKSILAQLPVSDAYVHSTASDPLQQFMFAVKFTPNADSTSGSVSSSSNTKIGFQKVSGINADLNVVEYHEGCTNYPMKLAGKASFGEAVFEKGVIPYEENSNLAETTNILDFLSDVASDGTKRMLVEVQLLGRDGTIRAAYQLHDAFVSKWEAPDLDATSDEVAIEKMTVQYDYFTYSTPSGTGTFTNWTPKEITDTENGDD